MAVAYLVLVRRMSRLLRSLATFASFGVVVGAIFSILPIPINGVAALMVVGVAIVWLRRRKAIRWRSLVAATAAGAMAIGIAIALPVKVLDAKVSPFHYEQMRLGDLCKALDRDHQIWVAPDPANANIRVAFGTDHTMTKGDVLQKLARDTGTDLTIGYCDSGETLLFGAFPAFTYLRGPGRQPDA